MAEWSNEITGFTVKKMDEDAHDDVFEQIPSSGTDGVGDTETLAIGRESGLVGGVDEMMVAPFVMEARGDAAAAGGDESGSTSSSTMESVVDEMDMQPATLTTEMRVGYMEAQVENLKVEVGKIKSRMHDLIDTQNGMLDKDIGLVKSVVTMAEFERMVDLAVTSGTKYGVSRRYITRFLCGEHGQVDSRYLQKKLGVVLKRKLASNEYLLSDSLFKINKD